MSVFRIGTRGSKLALTQAAMVATALHVAHPDLKIETITIKTSGDWKPEDGEHALPEATGGKANFAKEIEEALLRGEIDCGVHSLKDMAAVLPDGLVIDHCLPRADARDALLSNGATSIEDLAKGATIGTTSPRRRALLLAKRPDLNIVPLRGNVPTRIEKLRAGQVDATLLALAGLMRLGLEGEVASLLSIEDMLPAAGQGIIGIERREGDTRAAKLLAAIHHTETGLCAAAERSAVRAIGGSCHTPVGAYAEIVLGRLYLDVALAAEDGRKVTRQQGDCAAMLDDAVALGDKLGRAVCA